MTWNSNKFSTLRFKGSLNINMGLASGRVSEGKKWNICHQNDRKSFIHSPSQVWVNCPTTNFFSFCHCYHLIIILCIHTKHTSLINDLFFPNRSTDYTREKIFSLIPSLEVVLEGKFFPSLPSCNEKEKKKSLPAEEQVSCFIKVPLKILWIHFKSWIAR